MRYINRLVDYDDDGADDNDLRVITPPKDTRCTAVHRGLMSGLGRPKIDADTQSSLRKHLLKKQQSRLLLMKHTQNSEQRTYYDAFQVECRTKIRYWYFAIPFRRGYLYNYFMRVSSSSGFSQPRPSSTLALSHHITSAYGAVIECIHIPLNGP